MQPVPQKDRELRVNPWRGKTMNIVWNRPLIHIKDAEPEVKSKPNHKQI